MLLVKEWGRKWRSFPRYETPGSLIYMDEDLDDAAKRVLRDLTGLKNVDLMQFKAFGSKDRTRIPKMFTGWKGRKGQSGTNRDHRLLCHGKIDKTLNKNWMNTRQNGWHWKK